MKVESKYIQDVAYIGGYKVDFDGWNFVLHYGGLYIKRDNLNALRAFLRDHGCN